MARLNGKRCCWENDCYNGARLCRNPVLRSCFKSVKEAQREGKDFDKMVNNLDSLPKPLKQKRWEDFKKENQNQ